MIARAAILATVGGLCAALPAAAASFTPPPGCELEMTVQLHDCQVANHYRCETDPAGYRNIAFADGSGVFFISKLDNETRWMLSYSPETGEIDRLDQDGSADHASFSALLADGRDDYDFVTRNNFGDVRRNVGYDRLTGESVTIDGVVLERCEFDMTVEDEAGNFLAHRKGLQLISRKLRLFFADTEQFENVFGDKASTSMAPVTFAFPGDEGFGETRPKYDCDMLMTGASPLNDRPTL
ncbi:hypothetical protein OE699_08950 [Sedimentimonas flavescens]|uniref:Uncharacterized protein n=1 Tax=Sedimentimonas flavescens TaxID=2851012 RepID=A0ABT2ZZ88_9RHOB|nr:hypothetical protein [Sedimentimonas flavescens]MCV2878983.1 hypothetical protein [Sedimentimonas flavescens]